MNGQKRLSVLVCVTGQYDCDRLITVGHNLAVEKNWDLHVLFVHKPIPDYAYLGSEIEYLYRITAELGSDMTIMFNENASQTAVDYAKKVHAKQLITGMHDSTPNNFVFSFCELAPHIPVTMVTKENFVCSMDAKYV